MKFMREVEGVTYEIFDLQFTDEVAAVVAEAFTRYDPLAVSQNIPLANLTKFVGSLGPILAQEELTVIAKDKNTNVIIGAMITHDFATALPGDGEGPINTILNALDQQYMKTRTIIFGEYLHLFMLAVADQYSGRQVAQNLVEVCLENGIKKGYEVAVTEATGLISQHIFRSKSGFVERYEIQYKSFVYQDKKPFESIDGHPSVILMDKVLVE